MPNCCSWTTSFRSVPSIQAMINRAFVAHMDGNAGEPAGKAMFLFSPFREEYTEQPSIVALPVPKPYQSRFSQGAVNASLPECNRRLRRMVVEKSGWTVPRSRETPARAHTARP